MESKIALIDHTLDQLIPKPEGPHCTLFEAARYSLFSGGKRLRPVLLLTTAETLGTPLEKALSAACAIEMIHCYSLIHDDLPCMDDDDFRRGKPTLHRAFPESHAVLAGDYLLTRAFEVLAAEENLTPTQRLSLIRTIGNASGGRGMIGGQVLDIEAGGHEVTLEHLRMIHREKTGALLTASVIAGGIVANADESTLASLRRFGSAIGLAFQIIDDLLDLTDAKNQRNRGGSSDLANAKQTYATLLGSDKAQAEANALYQEALSALNEIPCKTTPLKQLAETVVLRTV